MTVSLQDTPQLGLLSTYDRLRFVVCYGGYATAVTGSPDAPATFRIWSPAWLMPGPGRMPLTVVGVTSGQPGDQVVQWTTDLAVASPAPSTPTALPATGG